MRPKKESTEWSHTDSICSETANLDNVAVPTRCVRADQLRHQITCPDTITVATEQVDNRGASGRYRVSLAGPLCGWRWPL